MISICDAASVLWHLVFRRKNHKSQIGIFSLQLLKCATCVRWKANIMFSKIMIGSIPWWCVNRLVNTNYALFVYLHWLWNTSWGELSDDILQNLMIFLHCSIGPICSVGSIGSVDLVGSIAVEFELHPLETIKHNHKHITQATIGGENWSWFLSPLEWRLQAEEH